MKSSSSKPARPTRRLSSANVKSISSSTSDSVVGASGFATAFPSQPPQASKILLDFHNQNFHCVVMFEPESSQCGEGLCSCHVLPACSLVVTCPVTDDVRYSDRIFSVQQIPHFHRVNARYLFEALAIRQSSCRLSSRHRSRLTIWTFEITFLPT